VYVINGIASPIANLVVMISPTIIRLVKKVKSLIEVSLGVTISKVSLITDSDSSKEEAPSITSQVEMTLFSDYGISIKASESNTDIKLSSSENETVSRLPCNLTRSCIGAPRNKTDEYSIDVSDWMSSLCVDITLMLTFGLASPLLGVIIACSIIVNTFLLRLSIGRYICIVTKAKGSSACSKFLEEAFEEQWRCLQLSWGIMSIFICLFWSLFVYDMTGGIAATVVMFVLSLSIFISFQRSTLVHPKNSNNGFRHSIKIEKTVLYAHKLIWRNIFRMKGEIITSRVSTIAETASPLGSSYLDVDIVKSNNVN